MPLSNLFKKSPKKESPKDDPFGSPELQKKRYDAAMEFAGVIQENFLSSEGKAHAGTVLSVAAWLAGTSFYRSLNYKHNPAPGTVMLSNDVNEQWPKLMNLFMYYLERNGTHLRSDQLILDPPDQHKPQMEILQVQEKFQDRYNEIMKKHGLDYLDGARAGMIVCSIIFQYHCTRVKDIDPSAAVGMVSMGIVTGAKTSPPPLKPYGMKSDDPIAVDKAKPYKQSVSRLVLGEHDAAIQNALDNGGTFIDINPEILKTLQENNIDPYLVYEKAMRMNIEQKVSRIDFVKAEVDELFDGWKGKPYAQAPIHVRLIIWLKNNAKTYGYEQSGNSWVLNNR